MSVTAGEQCEFEAGVSCVVDGERIALPDDGLCQRHILLAAELKMQRCSRCGQAQPMTDAVAAEGRDNSVRNKNHVSSRSKDDARGGRNNLTFKWAFQQTLQK